MSADRLRDELQELAFAGSSWPDLLRHIHHATGRPVRLVAVDGALLAQHGVAGEASGDHEGRSFDRIRPRVLDAAAIAAVDAADGAIDVPASDGTMRGLAVRAGERRVGVLLVGDAEGQGGVVADDVLAAAVTALAIVAVRRDAEAGAVAESAAWFVDELRFGWRRTDDDLLTMGRRFGVNLAQPHAAVVATYEGADERMWRTAVSWLDTPVRVDGGRAWTIAGGDVGHRVAVMQARLQEFVSSGEVRVAAGPVGVGAESLRSGFRLAGIVLGLGIRRRGPAASTYADVGTAGLLAQVPPEALRVFVAQHLGALEGRRDLLDTLDAWYATGGSRSRVAESVHLHRNSVGHRMHRIRDLLGVDPNDPVVAERLRTALAAADVLAVLDDAES